MSDRSTRRTQNKARRSCCSTPGLGSLFKKSRLERGVSIEKVAAYLEISEREVIGYEEEHKNIPLRHIYGLSNCLGVDPDLVLRFLHR